MLLGHFRVIVSVCVIVGELWCGMGVGMGVGMCVGMGVGMGVGVGLGMGGMIEKDQLWLYNEPYIQCHVNHAPPSRGKRCSYICLTPTCILVLTKSKGTMSVCVIEQASAPDSELM